MENSSPQTEKGWAAFAGRFAIGNGAQVEGHILGLVVGDRVIHHELLPAIGGLDETVVDADGPIGPEEDRVDDAGKTGIQLGL